VSVCRPGSRTQARAGLGVPSDALVLLFVGRIQPLKAPDVLLRAAADLLAHDPALRTRLLVVVNGGPSGSGLARPSPWSSSPPSSASATSCGSSRQARATGWRSGIAQPT
jgi:hypothetical protein